MSEPEKELSDFVATLTYDDVPKVARETVRRVFLDTVGVTLADAGAMAFEASGIDAATADAATILGVGTERPPAERALHTGTASHALDYDDLAWAMDGHPSVTLVPPLLALAPGVDASGGDFITAFAAGFEVECALAAPISPDHYEAGWHATATFGAFGAAAAAASLCDLSDADSAASSTTARVAPSPKRRPTNSQRSSRRSATTGTLRRRFGTPAIHRFNSSEDN